MNPAEPTAGPVSKANELNNLLQIISGTSARMENECEGSEVAKKYLAEVRASIERAEQLAAEIAQEAGRAMSGPGSASKSQTPGMSGVKHSILVVDDEEQTRQLVKHILDEAGYDVVTAQSGFQAVDLFRRRPNGFDLVLLDLTMPFMDGEETFARLRELKGDAAIVLCTGFIQQEGLNRLMAAGLAGFLRKPIPADEIVSVVRSTLENVKYLGAGFTGGVSAVG